MSTAFRDALAQLTAVLETHTPTRRRRRGRPPKLYMRADILLPQILIDWGKEQPEGLSGLCRRLLARERRRQKG